MTGDLIAVARGARKADLLIRGARLVNVLSGDVQETSVAVSGGRIAGLGDYEAREVMDLEGRYLCPGFIDAHVHLESSMVTPPEFARAVVPRGVTTVVTDPHEMANVLGLDGVRYMLRASENLPLRVFVMAPSCVPATEMETAGARLTAADIALMFNHPRVIGLAEMMNYPGVIAGDPDVLRKIEAAGSRPVDGHAPGVTGRDLAAYIAAGIGSDHESTHREEAREKLALGMHLMIREGTAERNLEDLLPVVTARNACRCSFCTDDRHPADLLREGGVDYSVRKAISLGLDPVTAIQMATVNTARYFGLKGIGAVAPGYAADLVVVEDLRVPEAVVVFHDGVKVADRGAYLFEPKEKAEILLRSTVNVDWMALDFAIPVPAGAARPRARVIELVPRQIVTRAIEETVTLRDGHAVSDPSRDLLKIAVVERHRASGRNTVGLVRGFGLQRGAMASSVAHDSHNIIVVGASDADMETAVIEVAKLRGGQVVVEGGRILASLSLPIAGLMSDLPLAEVGARVEELTRAAHGLGCKVPDPFMTMSFLALPVIPELKLTDQGLVDVRQFKVVPLLLDA